MINGVMLQYFEYDLSYRDHLWIRLIKDAANLSKLGITAVWMPPAFKGAGGKNDTGYGVYDLYDLGEFNQKGSVNTKYGSKEEYLYAIYTLHKYGISAYADMVFNHRFGFDDVNVANVRSVSASNRLKTTSKIHVAIVGTQFNYPARNNFYSSFKWTADHFTGVDYDFKAHKKGIYLLNNKQWSEHVSKENGNFDYLMGANVDLNNQDVKEELIRFGHWFNHISDIDGYRFDALKHVDYLFISEWFDAMRQDKNYFAVGEYWSGIFEELEEYLRNTSFRFSLFDVPLHYRFYECSKNQNSYDLRNLFKDTLSERYPLNAVTFVDNHDTQPHQALDSYISKSFKPIAYACILLREAGYPCVFYGDYYGLKKGNNSPIKTTLDKLLKIRKLYATGMQKEYADWDWQRGFTREGGLACIFSIREDGMIWMDVGKRYANTVFKDVLHHHEVTINEDGWGPFVCKKGSVSVYISK